MADSTNDNNNNNARLCPPAISVITEVPTSRSNLDENCRLMHGRQLSPSSGLSVPSSDQASPDRPFSSDTTRLMVHHAHSPTLSSLDGETLRSRSGSFNSTADTLARPRANSAATWSTNPESTNGGYDDVPLSEALKPDHRNEKDFHVDDNKFAFSPGQLNKMQNPKSLAAFHALGGLDGLAYGLRTDLVAGLSVDEGRLEGTISFEEATRPRGTKKGNGDRPQMADHSETQPHDADSQFFDRIRIFGCNRLPERKSTSFLKLFWDAYNDKIIILLTIAAVVSLSLGLYETFSGGSGVDWIEGVAICVAILIVTVVTATNDWQKERQFAKLNRRVSRFYLQTKRSQETYQDRKTIVKSKPFARGSRS